MVWAYSEVIFVWGTQWQTMILNTIAVLFLYVLNKLFFSVLLIDQTKIEVREHGQLQLTDGNKKILAISKSVTSYILFFSSYGEF